MLIFVFLYARINPSTVPAPLQHVTPIRRVPNHYQRHNHSSRGTTFTPRVLDATTAPDNSRREENDVMLESQSDDTKVLKRQLETEREKVKQLSAQLTTNVRLQNDFLCL